MKVDTPEIRWHYGPTGLNEAVLSIDYLRRPSSSPDASGELVDTSSSGSVNGTASAGSATPPVLPSVLATGGSDKEVRLWIMPVDDPLPVFVYTLSAHDRSVNCVRFSPDGSILASASDDSTIVLWMRPKHVSNDDALWDWSTVASNSDVGRVLLACGHKGDITDLSWSPDSQYLCSVSVDNTASIWHVPTAKLVEKRKDHSQFVQGVAWDPLSEFLVTTGNDRTSRVYALHGYHPPPSFHSCGATSPATPTPAPVISKKKKCQLLHTLRALKDAAKPPLAAAPVDVVKPPPKQLLFHDDTFPSFSRRPAWTPDGTFVLLPAGLTDATAHTAYVYARGNLHEPAFHLPGHDKGVLAIRCSPTLYSLRPAAASNTFGLPYRLVFAVATLTSVAVYDSQLSRPICVVDRVHYADLTDLSWSADGRELAASSLDGYVSLITLSDTDLGTPLPPHDLAQHLAIQRGTMSQNLPRGRKKAGAQGHAVTSPTKSPATLAAKKAKADVGASSILHFTKVIIPENDDGTSAVHAVAVRKKRKITPILVGEPSVAPVHAPTAVVLHEEPKDSVAATAEHATIDLTLDERDDVQGVVDNESSVNDM
ncbi:hypothetical protein DYB28_009474 [Aphanomyces astaci]|uniref:CAF1B/HIR1 beta-propeller domain-containing protein n=1 Tax=Aphanomyces astaci TaxID=112090 RepID=A0A9X8E8F9_APHAT|nr:hypothetical protein DYB28_009474 [Aphanomyces astaci]